MYISAHRVQAASRDGGFGRQGINAFYYRHGPQAWRGAPPEDFLPESNPGVFVDSSIEVPPPGNRVRSYLDVVAPDGVPLAHLAAAITAVPRAESLPVTWTVGDIWCRFGAELGLAPQWRRELQRLFARVALLYREQEPA
jgi:hypothetical protein